MTRHFTHVAGACEGSVACSTCHVILAPEHYDLLPEPEDDENDMLDMAFGLSDTSRLGCQVRLTRELDGMTATLPAATRNMFVDGTVFFGICLLLSILILCRKKTHPSLTEWCFKEDGTTLSSQIRWSTWDNMSCLPRVTTLQTFSLRFYVPSTSSPRRSKITISSPLLINMHLISNQK